MISVSQIGSVERQTYIVFDPEVNIYIHIPLGDKTTWPYKRWQFLMDKSNMITQSVSYEIVAAYITGENWLR